MLAWRRLSPFALAVHGIHFRQRLERISSVSVSGMCRGMGGMWRGWTVAAVVSRWSTRRGRSPHENSLSWRLISVNFRFHVLYFRSEHAVRRSGYRGTSSGIARGSSAFQGVPATSTDDVNVCRCSMHRRCTRNRTGCIRGPADAARMSGFYVAVLRRFAQLLTVQLFFRFTR